MTKVVGLDFFCLVRQAWRCGNFVGVHIERIGNPSPERKPESHQDHATDYSSLGSRHSKISSF